MIIGNKKRGNIGLVGRVHTIVKNNFSKAVRVNYL